MQHRHRNAKPWNHPLREKRQRQRHERHHRRKEQIDRGEHHRSHRPRHRRKSHRDRNQRHQHHRRNELTQNLPHRVIRRTAGPEDEVRNDQHHLNHDENSLRHQQRREIFPEQIAHPADRLGEHHQNQPGIHISRHLGGAVENSQKNADQHSDTGSDGQRRHIDRFPAQRIGEQRLPRHLPGNRVGRVSQYADRNSHQNQQIKCAFPHFQQR